MKAPAVAETAPARGAVKMHGAEVARKVETAGGPVVEAGPSVGTVETPAAGRVSLVAAIRQLQAAGRLELPAAGGFVTREWTPELEHALAQIVSLDRTVQVQAGSLEIAELVQHKMPEELASMAAAQIVAPGGGPEGPTSPQGGQPPQPPREFWFNVNAELVIYGATEPDAIVTLGGCGIKLRPDGTFSYRFALPDGQYALPAAATAADGTDSRWVNLQFARSTQYGGGVGSAPQDAALKPPPPESR
jgi:hypothetical protein